jgi:hypothetical protein
MRRGHDDAGEWLAIGVDKHHAQGDQGLAGSALRHDVRTPRDLPTLGDTHNGQGLGGIRLTKQLRDSR